MSAQVPKPQSPRPVDPRTLPALAPLTELRRWVGWRWKWIPKKRKWDKPPLQVNGDYAKNHDPATWAEFEAVWRRNGALDGIGFEFKELPSEELAAIDLDDVRNPGTGALLPWVEEIARASYCEITPSGEGLRVLGTARGLTIQRNIKHPGGGHFELYANCTRYITVSGHALDPAAPLSDITEIMLRLERVKPLPEGAIGDPIEIEDLPGRVHELVEAGTIEGRPVEHPGLESFTVVQHLKGAGYSEAQVIDLAERCPNGVFGKYAGRLRKELGRMWGKLADTDDGPPWQIKAGEPYATAKRLRELRYSVNGAPTLYHHRGGFYAWNGSAYPEVEAGEIRARAYAFLDECVTRVKDEDSGEWKQTPVKPNTNMVNNLLDALRAAALLPATIAAPAWLDHTPDIDAGDIIACANGLLHLQTMELLPHTPAFFTHNALDYNFERSAPEPAGWLAFLDQLWPDDTDSIETLQEMFGYCLGADTDQQKAFLIVGPKRSGKGTIGRVLTGLVGADNRVAPTLAELGTNFGLAPLIGKRVAIVSDARLGGRADQSAIAERLLSITGEDAITIDRKYREAWTGRLGVRFLVLSNELPRLADASGALASRFIVLVLTESFFGREDPGLTNRLLAERSGILNWAVEGWRRLRERGCFVQPAAAAEAVAELEDLGSPIGAFMRDRCVIAAGGTVTVDDLFFAWEEWCLEQRRDKPGDRQIFGRNLRAAVPGTVPKQRRVKGHGMERYYEGIRLKNEQERAGLIEEERAQLRTMIEPLL